VLILYQALIYGLVMRAYLHLSSVLIPWLLHQPDFCLYDTVLLQYAPGHLWFGMVLQSLVPEPVLRLRLFTVVISALITMGLYRLAERWWGTTAGLLVAAHFALWGPVLMTNLLYFEVVLGLLTLAVLLVWPASSTGWWRPAVAGLLTGMMLLVKQHAMMVAMVFVLWRLVDNSSARWRQIVAYTGGLVLPLGTVALTLVLQGRLDKALFWAGIFNLGPYAHMSAQFPGVDELVVVAIWALAIPWAVGTRIRSAESKRLWLLLGLWIALLLPAYPRYARFHLSGAVPITALLAGYAFFALRSNSRYGQRLYRFTLATSLIIALILPTYYRLKLGPLNGEWDSVQKVANWMYTIMPVSQEAFVWILPDIDPTANFYVAANRLPPPVWTPMYDWFYAVPGIEARVTAATRAVTPAAIIVVEKWQHQIPASHAAFLVASYQPVARTNIPDELGWITLYRPIEGQQSTAE